MSKNQWTLKLPKHSKADTPHPAPSQKGVLQRMASVQGYTHISLWTALSAPIVNCISWQSKRTLHTHALNANVWHRGVNFSLPNIKCWPTRSEVFCCCNIISQLLRSPLTSYLHPVEFDTAVSHRAFALNMVMRLRTFWAFFFLILFIFWVLDILKNVFPNWNVIYTLEVL